MIAVIADTHMPRGDRRLPERCVEVGGRTVAVVFGHSHLPLHEEEDGFQIFNPGSPTERRRAPRHSMGLLNCDAGGLAFEHVWL